MNDHYPNFHVIGFIVKGKFFKTMCVVTGPDDSSLFPKIFRNLEAVNKVSLVCDLTTRKMLKNCLGEETEVGDMLFGLFYYAQEIDSDLATQEVHKFA